MIINIRREEVARSVKYGTLLPAGWHKFKITKYEGKASKGGDSLNHNYEAKRVEHLDEELEPDLRFLFNSKAIGNMVPFIAALQGKKSREILDSLEDGDLEFDPESAVGQTLNIEINQREWPNGSGKFNNNANNFASDDNVPF